MTLEHNSRPLGEYTETEVLAMNAAEMSSVITTAQSEVINGHKLTPEEVANCVLIMVRQRQTAVRANPYATKTAKKDIDDTPPEFDLFE